MKVLPRVRRVWRLLAGAPRDGDRLTASRGWLAPLMAIAVALATGFLIIVATSGWATALAAYQGLFTGAVGSRKALAETLTAATPYMFAGLAVALGFQCGLFNIGAEGQLYMGALGAAIAGQIVGLPQWLHLPLALLVGCMAGAAWGFVPGWLKAKTNGHEVINTIMMNYIAVALVDYLVKNVLRDTHSTIPRTPYIQPGAHLPHLFAGFRLHAGLVLAVVAAAAVYWLLRATTLGFEVRTVGANPHAARYAGIRVARCYIVAMSCAGGLAGLAGCCEVLGLNYNLPAAFSSGYGFDSIAVALLGRSQPLAVIPAALLWGALRNGAGLMQLRSGISIDLVNIMQAIVILGIAAEAIWRSLFKVKGRELDLSKGWGA